VLVYLAVAYESPAPVTAQTVAPPQPSPQRALITQYCLTCHSDRVKAAGLALSELNLDAPEQHGEIAEKVIRKLRAGMMPPAGAPRPDSKVAASFVSWLENEIDRKSIAAAPGRVPLRRLNRREYANAIRDLLAFDVDAKAYLPDDNIKGNFDNNAAALQV